MKPLRKKPRRAGGVYIAVLGSAMIIALLGLCALFGQRIEGRIVADAADIRQAQLNASSAVELALLTMKQDTNWRSDYSNGDWFTKRTTGAGTCTANVVDPIDGSLSNSTDDPVVVTGIGYSGQAEQRASVTMDPRKSPLSCLRSAIAVGGNVSLSFDTLRTDGLITANQISSSGSQVYGSVQATSVSGSTFNGTTTQITSDKMPTMPDWTSVFNYYRTNGVQLDINSLPTWATMNLARNAGMENTISTADWMVAPSGSTATIDQSSQQHSGSKSLRVRNRSSQYTGPAQPIDTYVKAGQEYYVEAYVYHATSILGLIPVTKAFHISVYTQGSGDSGPQINATSDLNANGLQWTRISATINAPSWSGNLQYAYVKFACTDSSVDFLLDDVVIRETTSGRIIYQKVLSPSVDRLYTGAPTDPSGKGIYWINCGGNRLVIERSRIQGTLLVINPGANSCINNGPINWSPAVAGYPALLVDSDDGSTADFTIGATNRALSEKDDGVDYNLDGAAGDYIFASEIRGLIAVRHNLAFQNRSLIRGQIVVGNNIANSSGELEINYKPDSLLNPPPGFWSYIYQRRTNSVQKVVLP
ncbi:MAG TPA: carbohydrate binding domain-containing protein [Lacipirellulaceae bacterium]|nr:carbohydrate binding domain-containing protein [Lacipirellulaceae bacterium]